MHGGCSFCEKAGEKESALSWAREGEIVPRSLS